MLPTRVMLKVDTTCHVLQTTPITLFQVVRALGARQDVDAIRRVVLNHQLVLLPLRLLVTLPSVHDVVIGAHFVRCRHPTIPSSLVTFRLIIAHGLVGHWAAHL